MGTCDWRAGTRDAAEGDGEGPKNAGSARRLREVRGDGGVGSDGHWTKFLIFASGEAGINGGRTSGSLYIILVTPVRRSSVLSNH